MKIFQITTFYHPVTGGVESHVAFLNKYLTDLGHEVTVLTSDASKIGPRITPRKNIINGIKVQRFVTWFSLSQYHKFYPGLFFYLLRNDFDIVHVHGFRKLETYIALLAAKIKRKKVVLTTHNPFPTTTRTKSQDFLIKIHDLTIGRLLLNKLDKVITILKSEQEIFIKQFKVAKEKVTTVYNGLNPELLIAGSSKDFYESNGLNKDDWKALVVGCGRLNYAKGFQYLEKAVKSLPDVLFFIAGGDDGYLNQLTNIYKNCPNMVINGKYISHEKLRDVYAAADIFVLPSIHEATGTVMLEALAQGCAIIASNQGGTIEYLTNKHGIFIQPDDQESWLTEIENLINHPEKREQLSKDSKSFLKKYRWDTLASQLNKIYKTL